MNEWRRKAPETLNEAISGPDFLRVDFSRKMMTQAEFVNQFQMGEMAFDIKRIVHRGIRQREEGVTVEEVLTSMEESLNEDQRFLLNCWLIHEMVILKDCILENGLADAVPKLPSVAVELMDGDTSKEVFNAFAEYIKVLEREE